MVRHSYGSFRHQGRLATLIVESSMHLRHRPGARLLHFSRRSFIASAHEHMKARGFEHRHIRKITANTCTRYEGKIVGDSPEMCRALDSHASRTSRLPSSAVSPFPQTTTTKTHANLIWQHPPPSSVALSAHSQWLQPANVSSLSAWFVDRSIDYKGFVVPMRPFATVSAFKITRALHSRRRTHWKINRDYVSELRVSSRLCRLIPM